MNRDTTTAFQGRFPRGPESVAAGPPWPTASRSSLSAKKGSVSTEHRRRPARSTGKPARSTGNFVPLVTPRVARRATAIGGPQVSAAPQIATARVAVLAEYRAAASAETGIPELAAHRRRLLASATEAEADPADAMLLRVDRRSSGAAVTAATRGGSSPQGSGTDATAGTPQSPEAAAKDAGESRSLTPPLPTDGQVGGQRRGLRREARAAGATRSGGEAAYGVEAYTPLKAPAPVSRPLGAPNFVSVSTRPAALHSPDGKGRRQLSPRNSSPAGGGKRSEPTTGEVTEHVQTST